MAHHGNQVLSTPPSSHKPSRSSRRELSSSEESSSSTGSVMIDTSDKYRIGTPAPLPALPLAIRHPDPGSPRSHAFKSIELSILGALQNSSLRPYSLHMAQRYVFGEIPTDDDYTILIHTEQQDHWVSVVDTILEILQANNLRFRIEIWDVRAILSFFPVQLQPHTARRWESLELEIISLLGRGTDWRILTLLNRGHTREDCVPTVTVGLTGDADATWQKTMYEKLVDLVSQIGLEVAFIRSHLHATRFQASPLALNMNDFQDPVALGSTLGTGERTGTFGGYLNISYQGQDFLMGLTTHRVIQMDSITKDKNTNGLPPCFDRTHPSIECPSTEDTEKSQASIEADLDRVQTVLNGSDGNIGLRDKMEMSGGDSAPAKLRQSLEMQERAEEILMQRLDQIKNFDRFLGHVFASSGLTRYYGPVETTTDSQGKTYEFGNTVDWALILVKPSRSTSNTIDAFTDRFFNFVAPRDSNIVTARSDLPRKGESVFKKGRNGFSQGKINEIKTTIHFADKSPTPKYSRAWVIIGDLEVTDRTDFMRNGDSGCWLLDGMGRLMGLGFAGEAEYSLGYCIPISHVYDDIKQQTGAVITSPELF